MSEAERPALPNPPTFEQVPAELRELRRWVGWKATWDEEKKKWRKPPHSPTTGEAIGAVPKWQEHWVTFVEALAGAKKFELDGVGFVFVKADGYVGVDFDDCRSGDAVQSAVLTWLKWLPTYTEISPSGTGIHCIAKGKLAKALTATPLPSGGDAKVEIYNNARYFTFTGQRVGNATEVANCQVGLDKLLGELAREGRNDAPTDVAQRPMSKLTARKLHADNLAALRNARQGEGNALLNTTAFFAGRAFAAGALEGTPVTIQQQILDIVTKEWSSPHPEHGARQTVLSGWSSGEEQPLAIMEEAWPEVAETIEEFNKRYYIVRNFGGRCRVCWEEPSAAFSKGNTLILGSQTLADFKAYYQNELIVTGEKETKDGIEPKYEDKASVWLRHRHRRQYDEVIFAPNIQTPPTVRNLWHGFAYEPKKGDCSLYLKHVKDNVCRGEDAKYNFLIRWMAYAVTHPAEQGHVAIVVQGAKGVGKNVFAEAFSNLWGQHAIVVSDQIRITRNFNSHLRDKCVLIADEAFFAGDKRHEGNLKNLITGDSITIEAKGVDAVQVPNILRLIILSNEDWVVPASADERRYLVLNCGPGNIRDQRYFGALLYQLNHGGYSALLYHLMNDVDLKGFNVREAPHTHELDLQVGESLRGIEAAWYRCLYTGVVPGKPQKNGTVLMKAGEFLTWATNQRDFLLVFKPQHVGHLFGKRGEGKKKGFNFTQDQSLVKGERSRHYVIPPLHKARELWSEMRFPVEWPSDDGEWDTIIDSEVNF